DQRFKPASVLWPVESHRLQSVRIRAQAAMSAPLRKRLWQQLVRAKIQNQAEALRLCTGLSSPRLERLAGAVRSGDPSNVEGEAARIYWRLLFGADFRRDRSRSGVNALLNYGYTVLRSGVARAVMLAGLHPAFNIHHCNQRDTMPLVDDLIEPFRPVTDLLVHALAAEADGAPALTPEAKERLAGLTTVDMTYEGMASPVSECLLRTARSLADVCEGRKRKLLLPEGIREREPWDPP
ncbi:MAG: type II CRISPR-associated endonuclease Cas1, partial [Nitrospiraceae bacterium]|nr:type II CRISPR-associated endonuclease Cas1 [Nitrospiraceae bacterium]